jgi:hypothetical protein
MIYEKVFPLADALQIAIDVYRGSHGRYELRGGRKFVMPMSKHSDLILNTKIEASTFGDYASAVLVHISKDFWIYLIFDNAADTVGTLTMYYLSFEKQNIKTLKESVDGEDIDIALLALRPTIKEKFIRGGREIKWEAVPMNPKVRVKKEDTLAI